MITILDSRHLRKKSYYNLAEAVSMAMAMSAVKKAYIYLSLTIPMVGVGIGVYYTWLTFMSNGIHEMPQLALYCMMGSFFAGPFMIGAIVSKGGTDH